MLFCNFFDVSGSYTAVLFSILDARPFLDMTAQIMSYGIRNLEESCTKVYLSTIMP